MTARHTPGPWRFNESPSWPGVEAESGREIADICAAWGDEEVRANGCLIAAAPALYEALVEFSEAFSNRGETTSLHVWNDRLKAANEKARAALAQAAGEPAP